VHTTLFFYVIFVEIESEKVGDFLTRTETRYAVGTKSWFFSLFSPLIRFVMRKNWERFVADDRPLRSRRGDLRKQGFTFADVSPIDHRATLNIAGVGITPPLDSPGERIYEFNLSDNKAETKLAGESDHFGLRVQFEEDVIRIFPRLCPHRGASLDAKGTIGLTISCPWHGRKFPPLASIAVDGDCQTFVGPLHQCDYDGEKLIIRTLENKNMADGLDWTLAWTKV
jgi:nitrite reductase/ring-hydroxylating ferredoxin subunit